MPSDSTMALQESTDASNPRTTASPDLPPFVELRRFLRGVATGASSD